jgi:uncharacterized protein YpuA (DUF1002 family)
MNEKEENEFMRQVTNIPSESVSSVEIKQTTKGTTFTVKVYDADPEMAKELAETLFDQLGKKYPQVKA